MRNRCEARVPTGSGGRLQACGCPLAAGSRYCIVHAPQAHHEIKARPTTIEPPSGPLDAPYPPEHLAQEVARRSVRARCVRSTREAMRQTWKAWGAP